MLFQLVYLKLSLIFFQLLFMIPPTSQIVFQSLYVINH